MMKTWEDMTFAERIARSLRRKLELSEDAEKTIARDLERALWLIRYDMINKSDGRYDPFPDDIRAILRAAWEDGFKAARNERAE